MTEDDAKTKWCPMIQVTSSPHFNDIQFGDNRGNADESHSCIASDCMMWKWDIKLNRELAGGGQPEDAENIGYEGYCGLIKEG